MNKETRKQLELELILASEEILSRQHAEATAQIRKILKQHTRQVAKKFARAVKIFDKKLERKKPAPKSKPQPKATASNPKKPLRRKR